MARKLGHRSIRKLAGNITATFGQQRVMTAYAQLSPVYAIRDPVLGNGAIHGYGR